MIRFLKDLFDMKKRNKRLKLVPILILLAVASGTFISCSPANTGLADNDEILVYIKSFDSESGIITFDQVEWLTEENSDRLIEIGLDPDTDLPNGFYIYNELEKEESLKLLKGAEVYLVNWDDLSKPLETDEVELVKRLDEYVSPYHLTIENNIIVKVEEQYTP